MWVATTNDGLDSVLQHTAPTQRQQRQLIFIQNGMLLPWLQQHGLQENTQVLLYMSGEGCLVLCEAGSWHRLGSSHTAPGHVCTHTHTYPSQHCCCLLDYVSLPLSLLRMYLPLSLSPSFW